MKLTREKALELHRQMWQDMQDALGDNPSESERFVFKHDWVKEHGYVDEDGIPNIMDSCFLCEFAIGKRLENISFSKIRCEYCPIDWSALTPDKERAQYGFCLYTDDNGYEVWQVAPISKILALPERKDEE